MPGPRKLATPLAAERLRIVAEPALAWPVKASPPKSMSLVIVALPAVLWSKKTTPK